MIAQTNRMGTLHIEFNHVPPRRWKSYAGPTNNQGDAGTYCIIKENDYKGVAVSQGRSVLHINDFDSFNKEKGRKIALKNAIKVLRLPKEDRRALWNAYINR